LLSFLTDNRGNASCKRGITVLGEDPDHVLQSTKDNRGKGARKGDCRVKV
jgi:hypothetical protein